MGRLDLVRMGPIGDPARHDENAGIGPRREIQFLDGGTKNADQAAIEGRKVAGFHAVMIPRVEGGLIARELRSGDLRSIAL